MSLNPFKMNTLKDKFDKEDEEKEKKVEKVSNKKK